MWGQLMPGVFEGIPLPDEDREWLAIRQKLSNLPAVTQGSHRFTTWKDRPGLNEALEGTRAMITFSPKHPFLTLMGPPGSGKTHLALAVAWEALECFLSVAYWQVEDLLDTVRLGFESKEPVRGWEPNELLAYVSRCHLLVLDDLGAEKRTEWAEAKLDAVIDHRYVNRLPTIFTTNLELAKLAPRIADRLREGVVCVMKATSYRQVKHEQMGLKDNMRKAT